MLRFAAESIAELRCVSHRGEPSWGAPDECAGQHGITRGRRLWEGLDYLRHAVVLVAWLLALRAYRELWARRGAEGGA